MATQAAPWWKRLGAGVITGAADDDRSGIVAFCNILAAAIVLHAHSKTDIRTSADAAMASQPVADPFAFLLFARGIIGTGLLAVPVLARSRLRSRWAKHSSGEVRDGAAAPLNSRSGLGIMRVRIVFATGHFLLDERFLLLPDFFAVARLRPPDFGAEPLFLLADFLPELRLRLLPDFFAEARFLLLPPDFFLPPLSCLFTVRQARSSASPFDTPFFS